MDYISEADALEEWSDEGDHDYDDGTYDHNFDVWCQKNGKRTKLENMSESHLRNCVTLCRNRMINDHIDRVDYWDSWINYLLAELNSRKGKSARLTRIQATERGWEQPQPKPKAKPRGKFIRMRCHCGAEYETRQADLNRKWGLSCSKSCAAKRKKYNLPAGIKI